MFTQSLPVSLTGSNAVKKKHVFTSVCVCFQNITQFHNFTGKMEKDPLLTPTSVNTQGSCPVLDGTSLPSPTQIPPLLISNDTSAAPPHPAKSQAFTESRQLHHSPQPSPLAVTQSKDSPPPSDTKSLVNPPSETVLLNSFSSESNGKTLVSSPNCSSPHIPKTSSFSRLSQASSASASLACKTPTDPPLPSNGASTIDSAITSTPPVKCTFASVAKRVIIQERLRKAEENDAEEEEGEMTFS